MIKDIAAHKHRTIIRYYEEDSKLYFDFNSCNLLMIKGSFIVNVANDNIWEIRKPWFSLVSFKLITALFIVLTIKSFSSNMIERITYVLYHFIF